MTTPDPVREFTDSVLETIETHDLLPRAAGRGPPEPVVVGTSGGPDSVALLHVLDRFSPPRRAPDEAARLNIRLIVAHLHHGLREHTADEDQVFVENLAGRLRLPFETARADVRAEAAAAGVGLEEAGRSARRRFLADVARTHGARTVALAHHAGDRAETVLFHLLRGTGIEGLASLGPRAPLVPGEGIEIVRPLMHPRIGRALIEAYLERSGQDYRRDETNSTDAHTRNRIRNDLLPLLRKEVNPRVEEALLRAADQAAAAGEVLADALDTVWRQIVREAPAAGVARLASPAVGKPAPAASRLDKPAVPHGETQTVPGTFFVIDADDFVLLRPWMQGAILRRAVERLGGGLKHMGADRTHEVLKALLAKTVVGPIDLPGGLMAERNRRAIRIGRSA